MIDLVKKFFSKNTVDSMAEQEKEKPHDIRIATCAILLEMCHIDGEFSDSERERIVSILKADNNFSNEDAAALIAASKKELEGSIDLWQFTNLINQNYTIEEKIQVIETVWRIAYTDGKLDSHEDYLLHKLATLLRLTHKQLIEAKLKVKEGLCQAT